MSKEDLIDLAESPPTSVTGSSSSNEDTSPPWEPANVICEGINNSIINCRRCSIINGNNNTIGQNGQDLASKRLNGKYNSHIIGGSNISNMQDNMFYIGCDLSIKGSSYTISSNKDVIAYSTSDLNLKDNIKKIEKSEKQIKSINAVSFEWKNNPNSRDIGLIAQEIKEVIPEAVKERSDGFLAVDYKKIIPLLVYKIKKSQEKINKLNKIIDKISDE